MSPEAGIAEAALPLGGKRALVTGGRIGGPSPSCSPGKARR